ncbi:MAG: YitT family protein [Oscillospiraceae bacterium]|nr:YitT family protein [Oscillospiraceae bacterium]MBR0207817.1 YitT family protein [Oscillospiraceae bacterium]
MKKIFGDYTIHDVLIDLVYTVVGTALVGFSLSMFTVPNDIAPGGVSGLATALAYITPLHVSVWTLMMNIPLMIAAWRKLGPRAIFFTLIATLLLSVFIEAGDRWLPQYTSDRLVASLMGGVLTGLGMGMLFIRGVSTGGTDLLALILKKFLPNMPTGTLLMFVDASVVAVAALIFRDFDVAIYSAITIYVFSKVIDTLTQGVDYAKVIYTVTQRGEEIARALNEHTDRGSTLIPAFGGYTMEGKQIVMTVTRRSVVAQTLRLIRQTDPKSFTFVMDSTEVHGEGFRAD